MLRRYSQSDNMDHPQVKIDFLRARLASERATSKTNKNRVLELEEHVCQLERRLETEKSRRKRLELATKDLLLMVQFNLENSGSIHLSHVNSNRSVQQRPHRVTTVPEVATNGCTSKLSSILFSCSKSRAKVNNVGNVSSRFPKENVASVVPSPSGSCRNPTTVKTNETPKSSVSSGPLEMRIEQEDTMLEEDLHKRKSSSEESFYDLQDIKAPEDKEENAPEENTGPEKSSKIGHPPRVVKSCRTFKKRDDIE